MLARNNPNLGTAFGGSIALAALLLTGCTAVPPLASGYTFDHVTAAIVPGFHGSAAFRCTGDVPLEVMGTGATIAISGQDMAAFLMDGGPLAYEGDRGAIAFRPDYGGFRWTGPDPLLPLECIS